MRRPKEPCQNVFATYERAKCNETIHELRIDGNRTEHKNMEGDGYNETKNLKEHKDVHDMDGEGPRPVNSD